MKYIFFLLLLLPLQAKKSTRIKNDVCDSRCMGDKATAALNKKAFVPPATAATVSNAVASDGQTAPSQNHLKVLTLLQKLQRILHFIR